MIKMVMVYRLCKAKIEQKSYETKEAMQLMLDVFLIGARLDQVEYDELTLLLVSQE